MGLAIGIVGLPNTGKSTLFNALTAAQVAAENYPFCTVEPNLGTVAVPDPRLDALVGLLKTPRRVPGTLEFVDIAGLVKGASRGEGLGNQFLSHIREVDAVAHVLRCFEDPNVVHVTGAPDPAGDAAVVTTELCLKDLETVNKRREKAHTNTKIPGKAGEEAKHELALLDKVRAELDKAVPVRRQHLTDDERHLLAPLFLLTAKPVLFVANIAEGQIGREAGDPLVEAARATALADGAPLVTLCAQLEAEVHALPGPEQAEYLAAAGLSEPGLNRLVRAGYELLGLISFFTHNETECRAWSIRKGTKAPQAAGAIHTDFEKGFIRAEVIPWKELVTLGSEAAARHKGVLKVEGREYVVQDGDVVHFRFNV